VTWVSRRVDPEGGLGEFAALWLAETADELHRVLTLHRPIRGSSDAFEPFGLLSKHHQTEPSTSAVTAMLLVTDRRWRGGVGRLVRRIAESGMLDDEQLDLLARTFLAADDAVYWQVPYEWLGDAVISIDLRDNLSEEVQEPVAEGPVVVCRVVVPPLRRWAASRAVERDPAAWGQVLARARTLDARGGAAVAAGLVDAIDLLKPQVQELLIREAIRWPDKTVRRLGLALVAQREGIEASYALATGDPNAGIRAWADSLMNPLPSRDRPAVVGGAHRPATPKDDVAEPSTLF
jgi:hypothetical protein